MKKLIEKNNSLKPAKVGEIVEGKVIAKASGKLFLDLGRLGTGIIYGKEYLSAKDQLKNVEVGDSLFGKIIEVDNEEGYHELSVSQADLEIAWETLRKKKEKDETIRVKITGANKGGLLAEVSGISAFLPVSQLLSEHYPKIEDGDSVKILRELQRFTGKELEVKILDLDPKTNKLILSEKAKEDEKIKELLKQYQPGDIVEGQISGIVDFGAFLQFPLSNKTLGEEKTGTEKDKKETALTKEGRDENLTLEGLIHISELDWGLIEDPSTIVKVGERVKAKIIEISNGKVFLSLKALKEDPWQDIEKKYKTGDIINAQVVKLNPFGAFVQLTSKIYGLCHISHFGTKAKMEEKLTIGKKYNFQILEIKPQEHRLSLKLVE